MYDIMLYGGLIGEFIGLFVSFCLSRKMPKVDRKELPKMAYTGLIICVISSMMMILGLLIPMISNIR